MSLALRVVDATGAELSDTYLIRLGGWTEERYFAEAPEDRIVEFEEGEIIVASPATVSHQRLVRFLTFLLAGYARTKGLGEVLNGPAVVRLRPGLNYEPDVFFVPLSSLPQLEEKYFSGAPGLVIEVTSPGTRIRDLKDKAAAYRECGVPEYWVVEAQARVLYQHLAPTGARAGYRREEFRQGRVVSRGVPGFWVEVSWLWQEPLPQELACLQEILGSGC
jgi:Uma2 family endonuclease